MVGWCKTWTFCLSYNWHQTASIVVDSYLHDEVFNPHLTNDLRFLGSWVSLEYRQVLVVCPSVSVHHFQTSSQKEERGGSVVECWTEREVGGSKPTAAVLCPWARHFTPRKYWLITQEAVTPSRHDWKIVDWDVKPQHKQTIFSELTGPIKAKFHVGIQWDRGMKVCSNDASHVTKMATMPIYGKNPLKIFSKTYRPMTFKLDIQLRGLKPFKVCSNDDPWLTLTYFASRSTLLYGKILKNMVLKKLLKSMNWKLVQKVKKMSTLIIHMSNRGQNHWLLSKVTQIYAFKHLLLWSRLAHWSQILRRAFVGRKNESLFKRSWLWPKWPPCPYIVKTL